MKAACAGNLDKAMIASSKLQGLTCWPEKPSDEPPGGLRGMAKGLILLGGLPEQARESLLEVPSLDPYLSTWLSTDLHIYLSS